MRGDEGCQIKITSVFCLSRCREASIGYSTDGVSLSYSLGSTLVQSDDHSRNVLIRQMEINRVGGPNPRHTLASSPLDDSDIQASHERVTSIGTIRVGAGYLRSEELDVGTASGALGFIQWS